MDGFIAPLPPKRDEEPKPYWISNTFSRQLVHKWRSEEQAILVGTNTVLEDNPKLNVRDWTGKSPIRLIIDRNLKIQGNYHIYDKSVKTIIFTEVEDASKQFADIDFETIDFSKNVPEQICRTLHKKNIISILIEGGTRTLQSFIDSNLWDEARIFTGQNTFGEGLKAPKSNGKLHETLKIDSDLLNIYKND